MKNPNLNNSYKALVKSYAEYLQTLGFATTTVYGFPRYISDFLTWLEQKGISKINLLTSKMVFDYFAYLEGKRGERTKQTLSTAHLNQTFGAVDKFLEFLHHTGAKNTPSPTRYTLEHVRKKPLQVLTPEEIKILYNTIELTFSAMSFAVREPRQQTLKLVLDLCYGCALRRSEAFNVKLNDVNFDQRIIHVRQGKNYKDRFVPMSGKVYEGLQTYIYQYHRTFTKRAEYLYPFGRNTIDQSIKLLVKYSDSQSLKAKNPSPHTLRHSIATHLLKNGMDIERIARFLGHGTLESTKLYTHILNQYEEDQ
ncbi:MAG: hypothetical protein COA32_13735 [Fluviicola sp.]|nr:MAG: hypothetical protein COA32_13735 [Fluviicola sp.]